MTRILTTDTLFELEALPKRLGIVGVGAIGLELGLALSRLDVEVIAADQRFTVGGIEDSDVQNRAIARFMGTLQLWLGSSFDVGMAGEDVLMHTGEHRDRDGGGEG